MDFNRNFLRIFFNSLAFFSILLVCKVNLASGAASWVESKGMHLLRGVPVVTSPYLGDRSHFECLDLVTNLSSVNFDVRLLEQMKSAEILFKEQNIEFPREPMLDLSGKVEAKGVLDDPYKGKTTSDFNVSTVELDAVARVTTWGNAFISMKYDADPGAISTRRVSNSRVYVDQGFITIGNLNQSPFYMSMGQLTVPFGMHLTNMITQATTSVIGSSKQRAIVVGVKQNSLNGFHAAIYGFKGSTAIDTERNGRNEGGVNLDYNFTQGDVSGKVGASAISNIAENDGFQETGDSIFGGFAKGGSQALKERIVGFNLHGLLSYDQFSLISELVMAASKFKKEDLQFNKKDSQPLAWQLEGSYNFKGFKEIPSSVSAAYNYTREALILNLPAHRLVATYAMAIWRSTLQVIELKHDIDYDQADSGVGNNKTKTKNGTGKHATTLSLQIGFYF